MSGVNNQYDIDDDLNFPLPDLVHLDPAFNDNQFSGLPRLDDTAPLFNGESSHTEPEAARGVSRSGDLSRLSQTSPNQISAPIRDIERLLLSLPNLSLHVEQQTTGLNRRVATLEGQLRRTEQAWVTAA